MNRVLAALDLARYRSLLAAFHGFLSPWEQALQSASRMQHRRWNAARHVERLQADLAVAGGTALEGSACAPPRLHDAASSLGSLYVIEGSMLGGRIVSRRIESALGFTRHHGCRYFGAHDDDVGARWQAFRAALQQVDADAHCAAAQAARDTFERLHDWLQGCEVLE